MYEEFTVLASGRTYSECKANALSIATRKLGDNITIAASETVQPTANMWRLVATRVDYGNGRYSNDNVDGSFIFVYGTSEVYK